MIKLTELLNSVNQENKEGLVNIDDWRWPDVDHLVSMGFEFADDHHLTTDKEPHLTVYKKKDMDENGKPHEFFFVEEAKRETKRFKVFNDVIDYFDKYEQPEIDKNTK
jgi:hypothetical protein